MSQLAEEEFVIGFRYRSARAPLAQAGGKHAAATRPLSSRGGSESTDKMRARDAEPSSRTSVRKRHEHQNLRTVPNASGRISRPRNHGISNGRPSRARGPSR